MTPTKRVRGRGLRDRFHTILNDLQRSELEDCAAWARTRDLAPALMPWVGLILILGLALRAAAPVRHSDAFCRTLLLLLLGLLPLLWRWGSSGLVIGAPDALKRLGDPASLRRNQSGEPRRRLVKLLAASAFKCWQS